MFSVVPMVQLTVLVLESDFRDVLRTLGRLGVVQLRRTRAGPGTAPLPAPDHGGQIAHCDQLMARVRELWKSLELGAREQDQPHPTEIAVEQAEKSLQLLEQQVNARLSHRRQLADQQRELAGICEQVSGYRGLEIPLDGTDRFTFLHFVTGSLPEEHLPRLQSEIGREVALLPLSTRKGRQYLVAMTTRSATAEMESALARAEFHREDLPVIPGATADTLSETNLNQQATLSVQISQAEQQLRAFATEIAPQLAKVYQAVLLERSLLEAAQNFPRTERTVILRGWLPVDRTAALEQSIQEVTRGRCVIETTPAESLPDEQIPVLLKHPRALRPFEMLLKAYGLPRYHELEPTLFVGLTYLLMFGAMFGDVGHGAILVLIGLAALGAGRTMKARDAGLLVLFAGLSSMVFGAVYGSCFGLEQFKAHALWQDPLAGNPMALMYCAVGLGIVMISLGVILNIINHLRRGDLLGGVLDKHGVAGVVFYWGTIGLVTQSAALRSRGLLGLALVAFIVVPIAGWISKGVFEELRQRKSGHPDGASTGLGTVLAESLVGAFEGVLSYFANTVSFVRLAAYAMSHAAILLAAFMMAAELKRAGAAGGLLGVGIIILGNLVAILLEGIIVSVQALRLEYYEFFGKFFSGAGEPFKPFHFAGQGPASGQFGDAGPPDMRTTVPASG